MFNKAPAKNYTVITSTYTPEINLSKPVNYNYFQAEQQEDIGSILTEPLSSIYQDLGKTDTPETAPTKAQQGETDNTYLYVIGALILIGVFFYARK